MNGSSTGPPLGPPQPQKGRMDSLGPYKILKELGKGGMGVVFLAYQESLDRHVALKVILPHLAGNAGLMARFKRECHTHAQLEHPNIVRFFDSGQDQGFHFYAMEYLDAVPLDEIIKAASPPKDFRQVYQVAESMASSLAYLHGKGIIHRDIKPGNVMIERKTGRVVMMDFGLVKPSDVTRLTREGKTVGSPRYMAPEMIEGAPTDGRTDIYQVGVTLYQLATGVVPFDGPDLGALAAAILFGDLRPPSEVCPNIPLPLENFILNCMARDKENRYLSGEEMLQDVKRLRSGLSVRFLLPAEGIPSQSSGELSLPARPGSVSASVSRSASFSRSAPSLHSRNLSAIQTSTLEIRPTGKIPPLFPILFFLLVVSAVPFFLSSTVRYEALEIETIAGVHAAQISWRGSPSYPSRVVVRPEDSQDPDLSRIFLGDPPQEGRPHVLEIDPLDPEVTYLARIVFPDGTSSLPRTLPRAHQGNPRVEHQIRYLEDRVRMDLQCIPACKGSLRFRGADSWEDLSLPDSFQTQHELDLPTPPEDGAWKDAALQLQFVGRKETFALGAIPGKGLLQEDFCQSVEQLEMGPIFRTLGPNLKALKAEDFGLLVDQTLDLPQFSQIVEEIRLGDRLARGRSRDWRLYRALRKLEGIDSWLATQERPPLFQLQDTYRGLVRLSWPRQPPEGGRLLMNRDLGTVTSFMPQGSATESGAAILKVYANSTKIKTTEAHEGEFQLASDPEEGGRAAVALEVRNLHPSFRFELAFGGEEVIEFHTTKENFKGYFWIQVHDVSEAEAREAIQGYVQWIYAEFPASLLKRGRNSFRLSAHIQEGLDPNHFVDAYRMRLWPRAPGSD